MKVENQIKIALIQHPPVFLNLHESLIASEKWVIEAAENGAKIVIFPETWLPGYPIWLDNARDAAGWNHQGAIALYRILFHNSLETGSKEFRQLSALARKRKIIIVIGCHEVKGNTLYNTMFFFSGKEGDDSLHRKLMPTYNEKLIWGNGDGSTLNTIQSDFGMIGGLICWEHWMPLARAAMHAKNERIHIAQWPSVTELHQIASRHYAFEGRCFVAACGSTLSKKEVMEGFDSLEMDEPAAREMLDSIAKNDEDFLMTGGSCVIRPDAGYLVKPEFLTRTILYSTLDSDLIHESCMVLDTDGHYSRPDVFSLTVNEIPIENVKFVKNE
jgi:predicted amidohydrolase